MKEKQKLVEKGKILKPVVIIGKSGLTEEVKKEIKLQLKRQRLVKIKFLKSALDNKKRKEFARNIAKEVNAELIDSIGFVVVLKKK